VKEVLKSWDVGRRGGRPVARTAVLNEFCITDDRSDSRTRRDMSAVENTTAQTHTPTFLFTCRFVSQQNHLSSPSDGIFT